MKMDHSEKDRGNDNHYSLRNEITGLRVVLGGSSPIPTQLISMIPYAITVVVLVLFVGKSRAPAANGKPYVKSK